MKFVCLKYLDRTRWNAISEKDRRIFAEACHRYDAKLRESGHFFRCETVQMAGDAVNLHFAHGQLIVEDELTGKDNERLDGLIFLEARDLNHAIILVSDHPGIRAGWFRIHPADDKEERL